MLQNIASILLIFFLVNCQNRVQQDDKSSQSKIIQQKLFSSDSLKKYLLKTPCEKIKLLKTKIDGDVIRYMEDIAIDMENLGLNTSRSAGHHGLIYLSDSSFYNDILKWEKALGCSFPQ